MSNRWRAIAILLAGVLLYWFVWPALVPSPCEVVRVDAYSNWRLDGTAPTCERALEASRTIAGQRYGSIDGKAFWIEARRVHTGRVTMVDIEGPVAIDRLRPYAGGSYLSDGSAVLYGRHRVQTLSPPLDLARLRQLPAGRAKASGYATDGRWVLYGERVINGADASSFAPIPPPRGREGESAQFGRDARGVYHQDQRVSGADPATFRLIYVPDGDDRRGGLTDYAIDREHAWFEDAGALRLVASPDASEVRERLERAPMAPRASWKIPAEWIPVAAAAAMLGSVLLARPVVKRVLVRYGPKLWSPAAAAVATAFLILPTAFYAAAFTRCSGPDDSVVYALAGGALVVGMWLCGLTNAARMSPLDAVACAFFQTVLLGGVLVVASVPPALFDAIRSLPSAGMSTCPSRPPQPGAMTGGG